MAIKWSILCTSAAIALSLAGCSDAEKAEDASASNDPKIIAANTAQLLAELEPSQRERLESEYAEAQRMIKVNWDQYLENARKSYPNDPAPLGQFVDMMRSQLSNPQRELGQAQEELARLTNTEEPEQREPRDDRDRERMEAQRAERMAQQQSASAFAKARIANAQRIIGLNNQQIDAAAKRHPLVAEAVRRLRSSVIRRAMLTPLEWGSASKTAPL